MNATNLKGLEQQHSAALAMAASCPAGSPEHQDALRKADAIAARINDWHERANPTP